MRRRSFLQLGAAALVAGPGCARAAVPPSGRIRRLSLSHPDPRFGGFSALHLAANGQDCLLMSDRGLFVALRLLRDAEGDLLDAEVLSLTPMLGLRGEGLRAGGRDSEGLAMGPDGSLYVSFEGAGGGKIWRYRRPGAQAEAMPFSRSFASLPKNGALEALAMDPQGRLVAMPEDPPGPKLPLYRLEAQGWREIALLERTEGLKPVALDYGPDGALYLLERGFMAPVFQSRLSRLTLGPSTGRTVLWHSGWGQYGNLEGLSITLRSGRELRATMVADNNQLPFLANEMIELPLP